jgi:Trypsin-like peptidase domain
MAMDFRQKGALQKEFEKILDKDDLTQYLMFFNGLDLAVEVNDKDAFGTVVFDFISRADKQGYLIGFLEYLEIEHPNKDFKNFLDRLLQGTPVMARRELLTQLNTTKQTNGAGLEKFLKDGTGFVEVGPWLDGMANYLRWVCRIDYPGEMRRQGGTGFLVAEDLVLTNYHVLEDHIKNDAEPSNVTLTFDFAAGVQYPTTAKLASAGSWLVDHSPYSPRDAGDKGGIGPENDELDFALIRLERAVGKDQVNGRARGWCKLKKQAGVPAAGSQAFILQHPDLLPMKLAFGKFKELNVNSTRLRHGVDTDGGSSGAPILDADLNVVALHHGGDPDAVNGLADYNQAIPIGMIIDRWKARQITQFWS